MLCLPPDHLEFQTENCTVVGYGRPNSDGIGNSLAIDDGDGKQTFLSTSSLTIPSFQGDPTIFHKEIFLKQTPHIKNKCHHPANSIIPVSYT